MKRTELTETLALFKVYISLFALELLLEIFTFLLPYIMFHCKTLSLFTSSFKKSYFLLKTWLKRGTTFDLIGIHCKGD